MKHLKFILAIIIMLVIVILLFQNNEAFLTKIEFKLDLLFTQYKSSGIYLYIIVAITFLFGVIIAGLYGIMERFQLKRDLKALITISREKDKELNSLRNLPITSDNVGSGHLNSDVK